MPTAETQSFREMLAGPMPLTATLVSNPLMARLAEQAGFLALYLGGGMLGYSKVVLEANLNVTELVQAGNDIRAVCSLPLILDGATGFGDPMHMHRTIPMVEAAGFAAIEIEDQLIPKRAHHHAGVEHMIPADLMAAKVREAVAARRGEEFVIIARTNGIRSSNFEDAIERAAAYKAAGADVLMLSPRNAEEVRTIAERLEPPFMLLVGIGGTATLGVSNEELGRLGFRLLVDAAQPMLVAFRAWKELYDSTAEDLSSPVLTSEDGRRLRQELNEAVGLEELLKIERATVEDGEHGG
ncbi:MAG: isocitrate lyase/PEP mutase family protein [Dehalococcoidia bacterium]|nr:isocitrate lyase/PEP mutase family protein [Dehalococcoidia bacterium]